MLSFSEFRKKNTERCESAFHKIVSWSPAEWACAMAGECGEACNNVKKIRRLNGSEDGRKDLVSNVADELADMITYADLLASRLGIDLEAALIRKFNAVSKRVGSDVFIDSEA